MHRRAICVICSEMNGQNMTKTNPFNRLMVVVSFLPSSISYFRCGGYNAMKVWKQEQI